MRILAIDPGNTHSAWCLFQDGQPLRFAKQENVELLLDLRIRPLVDELMAIEMIASYGMPVGKEVFDTCLWIGRFIEARNHQAGESKLIYRKDVKLFHCQTVRATDANIRASLIDRFGPGREKAVGTKKAKGPLFGIKGDEWSALAIAVMVANTQADH